MEHVLESGKDVAILYHSPNCGHCKAIMPEWEALGELYKGSTEVSVAKLNAVDNFIGDHIEV